MLTENSKEEVMQKYAVSALRTWKETQNNAIRQREKELLQELQSKVPTSLKKWLFEAGDLAILHIIEYGRASQKYNDIEGELYGFTELSEFADRFYTLEEAWKDVVSISLDWDGASRFEVYFTAAKAAEATATPSSGGGPTTDDLENLYAHAGEQYLP